MKKQSFLVMIFFGLILFVVSTYSGFVQYEPIEEWVAKYNGPENGQDTALAVAVDSEGNVYVTGHIGGSGISSDYATIKYDKNGNQVWIDSYNGPKDGGDQANDIAVDSAGNVYVTGQSDYGTLTGTRCDYCTIKYDTNGNRLWVARYHNTKSLGSYIPNDFGYALAVYEDTSGKVFVYVTGSSYGVTDILKGPTSDYATIKYDGETGAELWVARYDNGNMDWCEKIAVDSAGNAYVTGYSMGVGTDYDYATIKYDTNGNQLWVARYNGPSNSYDGAYAIAVDSAGNVYVTGYSMGVGTYYDFATIKYDTNGNQLWVARYNGPGNLADIANSIAIDSAGNVYVTGDSISMGVEIDYDFATIQYDTNGNQQWITRYDSGPNDVAIDIAVDSEENIYVAGTSRGVDTDYDFCTIKYRQQFLSVQIDIKPGAYPNVINLGSNGNVPVAILSTANFDATTVDPTTITLAGADVKLKGNGSPLFSFVDVNGDGLLDILVHINTSAFELTDSDTEAVLKGKTFDGVRIRGVDTIRIVPS
jgi:hypothetical protein